MRLKIYIWCENECTLVHTEETRTRNYPGRQITYHIHQSWKDFGFWRPDQGTRVKPSTCTGDTPAWGGLTKASRSHKGTFSINQRPLAQGQERFEGEIRSVGSPRMQENTKANGMLLLLLVMERGLIEFRVSREASIT